MSSIAAQQFITIAFDVLDTTFEHVSGYYLEPGTSLLETLATVSAAEASIPVGGSCATLAAQVKHVAFYLDVMERECRSGGSDEAVDWGEIWRSTTAVTPGEWQALTTELRASYQRIKAAIRGMPDRFGEQQIGDLLAILAHSAYHLGEIRQALCVLRP